MDFIKEKFFPKGSKDIIKFQYKTTKGDLYIVTQGKIEWLLYHNDKKLKESEEFRNIAKLIPEGK